MSGKLKKNMKIKVKDQDKCCLPRCKNEPFIGYYGCPVCHKHWLKHCDENDKFNLKKELGIQS